MHAGMATIRRIESDEPRVIDGLSALLIDAVQDGASVGFLAPLSREAAMRYWKQALASLDDGLVLWVAESGEKVVGTVQLSLCAKETGRHRAELQKLLVLCSHRGNGIAKALLRATDEYAAANGRTLLVLDTIAGSPAESAYRHLGWCKAGEIPEYAAMPDGVLRATVYYYKRRPPGTESRA
jgi:GNAT superfamily N-acetyltransferase